MSQAAEDERFAKYIFLVYNYTVLQIFKMQLYKYTLLSILCETLKFKKHYNIYLLSSCLNFFNQNTALSYDKITEKNSCPSCNF